MKVWRLNASMKAMAINDSGTSEEDYSKTDFNGSFIEEWVPLTVVSIANKKKKGDYVYYTANVPVFYSRAVSLLNEYIAGNVQFLPAKHERELYFVNVTNIVDCIDYKRSILRQNPWNVFSGFERMFFIEEKLKDEYIFKIPELLHTHVFVTDQFKGMVEQLKLKDFDFEEIWDSELTPEIEAGRQAAYESKVAEMNALPGKMSWDEAHKLVEEGKAVSSGEWRLQKDNKGEIRLGVLTIDLKYIWSNPVYYPPVLLDLEWAEVELSEI